VPNDYCSKRLCRANTDSTSAVNYVDVPLTHGSGDDYSYNSTFHLRMTGTSSGHRTYVQWVNSGGSTINFAYTQYYQYSTSSGVLQANNQSSKELSVLPVYNLTCMNGANLLINITKPPWGNTTSPTVRIRQSHYYSNLVIYTDTLMMPEYNNAPTQPNAVRIYYNNTSSANTASYELYSGI